MSSDSLAALRKTSGADFADLAEQHLKHDLEQGDRDVLEKAAKSLGSYALAGSVIGVSLSVLLAFRVRSMRTKTFQAFKATEKPTKVQFADGRSEAIPDITNLVKPTIIGDFATYTFFGAGGLFLGGELGGLAGSVSAKSKLSSDPESKKRIELAFRRFRADVLRKEADDLVNGKGTVIGFE